MNTPSFPPPTPQPEPVPSRSHHGVGDPLLDERLARLADRRTGRQHEATPDNGRTAAPRAARSGRSHPARGSRAAALALSVTTTVGLAAYLQQAAAADESSSSSTGTISASSASESTAAPSTAAAETTTAASETTAVAVAAETVTESASGLADGTYTGDTETNRWGDVQVQITVTGGEITDVTVLQYPDEDDKSVRINQQALPTLIQSTLTAQSADVDTVSGATYTSDSYRESLQTAIDDARAAATA